LVLKKVKTPLMNRETNKKQGITKEPIEYTIFRLLNLNEAHILYNCFDGVTKIPFYQGLHTHTLIGVIVLEPKIQKIFF